MASRPWENLTYNPQSISNGLGNDTGSQFANRSYSHQPLTVEGGGGGSTKPRPPPRAGFSSISMNSPYSSTYSGYNNYSLYSGNNNDYNTYRPIYNRSLYSPGSFGGYGGYGISPYGGGYNAYGYGNNTSGFALEAEESTREAFQNIGGIVQAFGSITMMLESTFNAVQSSFHAVLSVADHFGRLKSHFGQIFSVLALIRTLKWLYKKLLYLIGLRNADPSTEAAWRAAAVDPKGFEEDVKASKSSWLSVAFLGLVYLGPIIIWRMLSSIMTDAANSHTDWHKSGTEQRVALVLYYHQAQNPDELTVHRGDHLRLAPQRLQRHRDWPLAHNGTRSGLVPANYIRVVDKGESKPLDVNKRLAPLPSGQNSSSIDTLWGPRVASTQGDKFQKNQNVNPQVIDKSGSVKESIENTADNIKSGAITAVDKREDLVNDKHNINNDVNCTQSNNVDDINGNMSESPSNPS